VFFFWFGGVLSGMVGLARIVDQLIWWCNVSGWCPAAMIMIIVLCLLLALVPGLLIYGTALHSAVQLTLRRHSPTAV